MALVKFVLIGPNKGRTIGFSKDHTGKTRYNFVKGVMEVHPTKVNGRFIRFMKTTYGAVLEQDLPKGEGDGIGKADAKGDESLGSEAVSSDLTEEQPSPAARSAVKLSGNDNPKAGKKKRPAK